MVRSWSNQPASCDYCPTSSECIHTNVPSTTRRYTSKELGLPLYWLANHVGEMGICWTTCTCWTCLFFVQNPAKIWCIHSVRLLTETGNYLWRHSKKLCNEYKERKYIAVHTTFHGSTNLNSQDFDACVDNVCQVLFPEKKENLGSRLAFYSPLSYAGLLTFSFLFFYPSSSFA